MPVSRKLTISVLIFLASAAGFLINAGLHAQPGTQTDPVVSLSYLETALRTEAVLLEGGEEFPVAGGRGVALLEGTCRLSGPPGGGWWIVDATDGAVHRAYIDMVPGHLYLPVANAAEDATFTLEAMQNSTVAVPAGSGVE
jgi:hypothetical protein